VGLVAVVGPNGAGKTSLLEAVHVGTQGFSLRTRRDERAVRFGATAARVAVRGVRGRDVAFASEVTIQPGEGKRLLLDGAPAGSVEQLRLALPVLAFAPDRLAVVKGGPLVRRLYLDRAIGRVFPARAALPGEYGRALAQRNAALRSARAGSSGREAIDPWTELLARTGSELERARAAAVTALRPGFAAHSADLGLNAAELAYEATELTTAALNDRLPRDLERGTTSAGPHLRDVAITAGGHDLRAFGSQGEQRVAVLALLLAEADVVTTERGEPPLLLLDDLLSELDDQRRLDLLTGLPERCQAMVTATSLRSFPPQAPPLAGVVEVEGGRATLR
jgi:DNA replication and repair protein RecF